MCAQEIETDRQTDKQTETERKRQREKQRQRDRERHADAIISSKFLNSTNNDLRLKLSRSVNFPTRRRRQCKPRMTSANFFKRNNYARVSLSDLSGENRNPERKRKKISNPPIFRNVGLQPRSAADVEQTFKEHH